jgi:hypothetical protein
MDMGAMAVFLMQTLFFSTVGETGYLMQLWPTFSCY